MIIKGYTKEVESYYIYQLEKNNGVLEWGAVLDEDGRGGIRYDHLSFVPKSYVYIGSFSHYIPLTTKIPYKGLDGTPPE